MRGQAPHQRQQVRLVVNDKQLGPPGQRYTRE
jgi:hypothetical protein